jgi:hypothetical protein
MMAKQPGYQNSGYKLFDAGFAALAELEKGKLCEWSEEEVVGFGDIWDGAAATTVPHLVAILPCDGVLGSAHPWI